MAVRILALGIGRDIRISLQRGMDDSALIGIHGLQRHGSAGALHLVGDVSRKALQLLFPAFTVVLCVKLDADVDVAVLVYHKADQILERIQGLSALSDQDAHVVSAHHHVQLIVLVIEIRVDGNFLIHDPKDLSQEFHCFSLDLICLRLKDLAADVFFAALSRKYGS